MSCGKKKLLINTDAGIDDAQAILMALKDPDVEVVAITTSHGNTDEHHVCGNVLRVLKLAGRLDIPVYRGCSKPLAGKQIKATYFHGTDGFGDVPDPEAPELTLAQSEHASLAIIRLAYEHQGELILVQLGPSTNVALALRIDPEFGRKLKASYMMAGAYEGIGNITTCAEFNVYADPEAAAVVLEELDCPLYLVCWELCLKNAMTLSWYESYTNKPTAAAKFIKSILEKAIKNYYQKWQQYITPDQLLMAVTLRHDQLVKDMKLANCVIETSGSYSRGMMVVAWPNRLRGELEDDTIRSVYIITDLDHDTYTEILFRVTD